MNLHHSLAHVGWLSEFPWSPHATYWLGPWLLGLTSSPVVPPAFLETRGCPLQSHPLHCREPKGKFHGRAKESSDPHQHLWLCPGLYSKGPSEMDSSPPRDIISWDSARLEGSGSKSRVGKEKKSLISTSGHSLVTACPDTNHPIQVWNDYTTAILVLG